MNRIILHAFGKKTYAARGNSDKCNVDDSRDSFETERRDYRSPMMRG